MRIDDGPEPEEWTLLRESIRRILDKEASLESVRRWEQAHEYPEAFFRLLAESGFIAMPFAPEWGGAGAGPEEMVVVAEELGRRGMDIAAGYGLSVFLGLTVERHGSEGQRAALLPDVLAGRRRLSVSITEPDAGSDAAGISTTARPKGDGYLLRGQKVFTTGAGLPNTTLVVSAQAVDGAGEGLGVSLFLVPADAEGVTLKRLNTVGRHILGTYEVFLEDVAVGELELLGPLGAGWAVLREGLTLERLFTCAGYVGSLAAVLDLTVAYVASRHQFGQAIGEFQAVSHPIADAFADHAASRLLTYAAAAKVGAGGDARIDVSTAKLFVTEAYQRATTHAMQAFGGYGYMEEYHIARYWRDARVATISAGSSQIQREIICRKLGLRGMSDLEDVVAGLHRFVASVVEPLEEEHAALLENPRRYYDESGVISPEVLAVRREVRTRSADAGYYTLFASAHLGGAGLGMAALYRVWESLHHRYGPGRVLPYDAVGHWTAGPGLILDGVSPTLRERVQDDIMSGRKVMCFAMSEPDAGSDAWGMRTRAVREDGGWRISGTKQWTTNGPTAEFGLVFAVTDEERRSQKRGGISAFLVPMDSPGVRVDSVIKLFGEIGGHEAILSFTDVSVTDEQVVGELGEGMRIGLSGVGIGRIYNAARGVGLGRWALERSVAYANERVAFGAPIGTNQGVSFPLAETAIELYAASTMAADCAERLDAGVRSTKELAMVKAFCTEACFRAFDRAIQVHGGMGLTNELHLVEGLAKARLVRIADGTAEIMRRTIWRELSKGDLEIGPLDL